MVFKYLILKFDYIHNCNDFIGKMITGLEIPFTLALLYPSLTVYWLYPKLKPEVEKEVEHEQQEMDGVEMWDYHNKTIPPTYINLNNIIVPVGGGMDRVTKMLLTKHISKDKKKEYFNFHQIEDEADIKLSKTKSSHINTQEAFKKTFRYYNIPTDKFAVNLPLKIKYYNYKNGFYIHKLGLVASNKDKLVREILWRKRLPLTMTIPTLAGLGLICCWTHYALQYDSIYIKKYYPPFHYKRIMGYFSSKK
jgi:hypothetical protein